MNTNDISSAVKQICEEKGLTMEDVISTIEAALAAAYRKDYGEKNQNIKVNFDITTGGMEVYDEKTVVEDMPKEEKAEDGIAVISAGAKVGDINGKKTKKQENKKTKNDITMGADDENKLTVNEQQGGGEAELVKKFNPKTEIQVSEAQNLKKKAKIGDVIRTPLKLPSGFGRMAAQTAKQVIIQKLREAERNALYNDFKEKEGEVMTGVIQRREGRNFSIDLGKIMGVLPYEEQIPRERYNSGSRFKVYILSVENTPKGPLVAVSRTHPNIVKQVFSVEIPEIANNLIEIRGVAREAGMRSKIAVESKQENIDPIGSCVGQRGTRVQTIIGELGGEKVDIIEYEEKAEKFIANALSPAKISSIETYDKEKKAIVKVKEDQLSLAIGRGGQNVRLAGQLTGWKLDIVAEKESGEVEKVVEEGEVVAPVNDGGAENESAGGEAAEGDESEEEKKTKKQRNKKTNDGDDEGSPSASHSARLRSRGLSPVSTPSARRRGEGAQAEGSGPVAGEGVVEDGGEEKKQESKKANESVAGDAAVDEGGKKQ